MAFFVYTHRSTLLHRLHPAAKAVWLLSYGLILSIFFDPLPLAGLFLICMPFFIIGKVPWRRWLPILVTMFLFGMFGFFVVSLWLSYPEVFTRYPDLMGITLWRIAGEDFFLGAMAVSVGGLMYTVGQGLRSITLVLIIAVFIYSTRPNDLIYLLTKARVPTKIVFVVMVAFRFFPHIFHKLSISISAQKLRGWELVLRDPIRMARQFLPVAIPVLTETVRLADHTTWAVESRAFGTGRFTLHHELQVTKADWLFAGFWLAVMVVFLWLYIGYGIGPL